MKRRSFLQALLGAGAVAATGVSIAAEEPVAEIQVKKVIEPENPSSRGLVVDHTHTHTAGEIRGFNELIEENESS
jgi:hypothetical protein